MGHFIRATLVRSTLSSLFPGSHPWAPARLELLLLLPPLMRASLFMLQCGGCKKRRNEPAPGSSASLETEYLRTHFKCFVLGYVTQSPSQCSEGGRRVPPKRRQKGGTEGVTCHGLARAFFTQPLGGGCYRLLFTGEGTEAQRVKCGAQTLMDGKQQRWLKGRLCWTKAYVLLSAFTSSPVKGFQMRHGKSSKVATFRDHPHPQHFLRKTFSSLPPPGPPTSWSIYTPHPAAHSPDVTSPTAIIRWVAFCGKEQRPQPNGARTIGCISCFIKLRGRMGSSDLVSEGSRLLFPLPFCATFPCTNRTVAPATLHGCKMAAHDFQSLHVQEREEVSSRVL